MLCFLKYEYEHLLEPGEHLGEYNVPPVTMLHNTCISTRPLGPNRAPKIIVLNQVQYVRLVREVPSGKNGRNEFK